MTSYPVEIQFQTAAFTARLRFKWTDYAAGEWLYVQIDLSTPPLPHSPVSNPAPPEFRRAAALCAPPTPILRDDPRRLAEALERHFHREERTHFFSREAGFRVELSAPEEADGLAYCELALFLNMGRFGRDGEISWFGAESLVEEDELRILSADLRRVIARLDE